MNESIKTKLKIAIFTIIMALIVLGINTNVFAAYNYEEELKKGTDYFLTDESINFAVNNVGQPVICDTNNDFKDLVMRYTNLICFDKSGKMTYSEKIRVVGVLTCNSTGSNPCASRFYYASNLQHQKGESGAAARIAYEAYFATIDGNKHVSEFQNYYYSRVQGSGTDGILSYIKSFGVGNVDGLSNYNGVHANSTAYGQRMEKNSIAYMKFAWELTQKGKGKSIVKTDESKTNPTISGSRIGPFSFDAYVVDKFEYDKSDYSDAATDYQIKLDSVTINGTTYTSGISVEGISDLKNGLQAGQQFYVNVPVSVSEGEAASAKVVFKANYYTYYGRAILMASSTGDSQARLLLVGKRLAREDKVEFLVNAPGEPTPPQEVDVPVIIIDKVDENGARLPDVTLEIKVDDTYGIIATSSENSDEYITIDFSELVESDTEVQSELNNITKNNAGKLFDEDYQCKESQTRIELEDVRQYVKEQVKKNLMPRVTGSGTYQMWEAHVNACRCPHGYQHGIGNCIWVPATEDTPGHWESCNRHCCELCPRYQAAMKAAVAAVDTYADTYPEDTDELRDWLYDQKFDTADHSEIIFGTAIDNIPNGEIDSVPFVYTVWKFYQAHKDQEITKLDLMKVYTGDLRVDITEIATADGYLLWENENTKHIEIQYGTTGGESNQGGDVQNGMDIESNNKKVMNANTYKDNTNDEVELEHEGIKDDPSDGTYDVTKITAYNEADDIVVFELNKYGELANGNNSDTRDLEASFLVEMTATESYWDGSSRELSAEFEIETSGGQATLTTEDYWRELGIDVIHRWSGTIEITITEIDTNQNYILWDHHKTIFIEYEWGEIINIEETDEHETTDEDAIEEDSSGVKLIVDAYNTAYTAPQIVIHKNELGGSALEGVVFDAVVEASNGGSVSLSDLKTNDAGEIIIYARDLEPLKIDVINRWEGTITVTLTEKEVPDGYQKIDGDIVVTIEYSHGEIVSVSSDISKRQEGTNPDTTYTDNDGYDGDSPTAAITIENELENTLRLRKVDGDTESQDYLAGATFSGKVTAKPEKGGTITSSFRNKKTTDKEEGYIDILEDSKISLSDFTGKIEVEITEVKSPKDYVGINVPLKVTLTYANGYLKGIKYDEDLSKTILDVGVSEDGKDVIIAVKNSKPKTELQPIYLGKVDKFTGVTLSNVNFRISVSTAEIEKKVIRDEKGNIIGEKAETGKIDTKEYKTDDDGLITIMPETLNELGVTNTYDGEVFVLIEELGGKTGYKTLPDKIYVKVNYKKGNIESVKLLKGQGYAECSLATIEEVKLLKITAQNEWKIPDLIISKESLTNDLAEIIRDVKLSVNVRVSGKNNDTGRNISGTINISSQKVDSNGQIIISSEEIEKQIKGINGSFEGTMTVAINETSGNGSAVIIPGEVTAILTLKNGRFIKGEVSNATHLSIKDDEVKITLKVLDSIEIKEPIIISGIVWEELATTKADGILIDGLYTTSNGIFTEGSESEYSDRLFEGIEVTLYQKYGDDLKFVEVTQGTNPTITDSKGYYEFTGINKANNYVIKFTYNGQEYNAAPTKEEYAYKSEGTGYEKITKICSTCDGKGKIGSEETTLQTVKENCTICSGRGKIETQEKKLQTVKENCTICNGRGKIETDGKKLQIVKEECTACRGRGKIQSTTEKCQGTLSTVFIINDHKENLDKDKECTLCGINKKCESCGKKYSTECRQDPEDPPKYTRTYKVQLSCNTCGSLGASYDACSIDCAEKISDKKKTEKNSCGQYIYSECTNCKGIGRVDKTVEVNGKIYTTCTGCKGIGKVDKTKEVIEKHYETCSGCKGIGKINKTIEVTKGHYTTCTDCNGIGRISLTQSTDGSRAPTMGGDSSNGGSSDWNGIDPQREIPKLEQLSSKGSEITNSRKKLNEEFSEIGSYPANYKINTNNGKTIFDESDYNRINDSTQGKAIKESLRAGYNTAYRYAEIKDVYENVTIETRKYLAENTYIRDNDINAFRTIYINVVNRHYVRENGITDDEIFNKLQFIYDSRLSAYAGRYTKEGGIVSEVKEEENKNITTYGEYRYANLGLMKRDNVNLELKKDLYEATISINRYDETYKFNSGIGEYKQYVYEEDYNYKGNPNNPGELLSDGIAKYDDDEIELYLKYKITVENKFDVPTKLTEVVDYFDYRFCYKDEYITTKGTKLAGVEVSRGAASAEVGTRYYKASEIGLSGTDKYSAVYVKFNDEPELGEGEKVEIYITIKLGKDNEPKIASKYEGGNKMAREILYDFIRAKDDNAVMPVQNYAEINGYRTKEGNLDSNSKPGNFVVKEFEEAKDKYDEAYKNHDREEFTAALDRIKDIRQDDAWSVLTNISNNLEKKPENNEKHEYYHRTMSGNVWEAVTDKVHTGTNLYNDELLEYIKNNGLKGIIVELVEVEEVTGNQYVRARTVTGDNGEYLFRNYIPGDYSVRFTYGASGDNYGDSGNKDNYSDAQNMSIDGISRNNYTNHNGEIFNGVNGQYYQSTKANPDTDKVKYWYAKYTGEGNNIKYEASTNPGVVGDKNTTRYSDAYDEVTSRIDQIEAQTVGDKALKNSEGKAEVNNSWSWNYEWDGVESVQRENGNKHIDQVEAYTSTMKVEVEYTKENVTGNQNYDYYRYKVEEVDFGLTPRAIADLEIDKYVSNVKLYLQDGTKQLDVDFNYDPATGKITTYNYTNESKYQNIVLPNYNSIQDLDGLITVLFDEQEYNGTTLEVTYTMRVKNTGEMNTLTYFYENKPGSERDKPIAVAYYNGHRENLESLVYYEQDRQKAGITKPIVKHNTDAKKFEIKNAGYDLGIDVKTRATNIVDYVDPSLTFTQESQAKLQNDKKEGRKGPIDINKNWEITTTPEFNSTRLIDSDADAKEIMTKYNTIIRAKGGETYTSYLQYLADCANGIEANTYNKQEDPDNWSILYTPLVAGEEVETKLTLSKVLQTTSTETNDYQYSNLAEITKLENYAGKSIYMESYDIDGALEKHPDGIEQRPETSKDPTRIYEKIVDHKTLGTSKSETVIIRTSEGLNKLEEIEANLSIVFIALIILAGGIVLIKKFVLTTKE